MSSSFYFCSRVLTHKHRDESHVMVQFTPVLQAYINSDYQQTAIIQGAINTPVVWKQNSEIRTRELEIPELRISEQEIDHTDPDDLEYKLNKVQNQLDKDDKDDEDHNSLAGAPERDTYNLSTFDNQPTHPTDAVPAFTLLTQPTAWPVPPTMPSKPITTPRVPAKPAKHLVVQPSSQQVTQLIVKRRMATATPNWFHGQADENAQNFLRDMDRYIMLNELKTETGKVMVLSTLLSAGSVADTWWMKLESLKKSMWQDMRTAFTERWPAITVTEKTGLNYQREILVLRLTEEEIGTQVSIMDVTTWAHLQFYNSLQQLVNEVGAATIAGWC
ncbi:hypothetical protein EDB19DRAFT_1833269 [Suillus lakei]|nr:hypothetical protein EDB19DRAFT_1833269 [Suillus lakei]